MPQEPTSGLDSVAAASLMATLNDYAQLADKTVITTIHQPAADVFRKFASVLLLIEGQVTKLLHCSSISSSSSNGSNGIWALLSIRWLTERVGS